MRFRTVLEHAVIVGYLLITASALVFTLSIQRVTPPFIPRFFLYWSYGMMAPYQGDDAWNSALMTQGRRLDGAWVNVSLDRYMPYGAGERNAREFFRVFQAQGDDVKLAKLQDFLRQFQRHEAQQGNTYTSVRAYWDTWPRSTGGFQFLHQPLFTKRVFITQVP